MNRKRVTNNICLCAGGLRVFSDIYVFQVMAHAQATLKAEYVPGPTSVGFS